MNHQDDQRTILSLLGHPYELDPASIDTLVDFATRLDDRSLERLLFTALNELRSPVEKLNLTRFLRGVVDERPSLARILKNAIKPKGRCRPGARSVVLEALGIPDQGIRQRAVASSPAPRPPSESIYVSGEIVLNPQTTSFYNLPRLFDALATAEHQGGGTPAIRVNDFVYASALAIVATWSNARGAHAPVVADGYTNAYLRRIGFHEALRGGEMPPLGDPEDWSVRLTAIEQGLTVEDVTDRILNILDTFVHPNREDRNSFGILLGELIENVNRHANAKSPGFVVAQVYPRQYRLGITIADPGIGIRQSFLEGDVECLKNPDWSDGDCIAKALEPLVTSKASRHSGYGLYILSELLRRNGGTFAVTSGAETVVGYRVGRHNVDKRHMHEPWRGTSVTMILNLQNPLPLGEVYRTLPLPKGYTEEDFFDE